MSNQRFVNWEVLKNHLPVFIDIKLEEKLDRLIDLIEEDLILKKASEIQQKRNIDKETKV